VLFADNGDLLLASKNVKDLAVSMDFSAMIREIRNEVFRSDFHTNTSRSILLSDGRVLSIFKSIIQIQDFGVESNNILITPSLLENFQLFDDVEAGVYSIGADKHTILYMNRTAAMIFGYKSVEELKRDTGGDVLNLYVSQKDFNELIGDLGKGGVVINRPIRMKKKDRGEITILVTVKQIMKDGKCVRRDGVFTFIENIDKILMMLNLQTGIYEVTYKTKEIGVNIPIITDCDDEFAKMFGFKSASDIKDIVDIRDLYVNPGDVKEFEKDLVKHAYKNEPMHNRIVRVKRLDTRKVFWIMVDCEMTGDPNKPIGRRGTVRDVTELMMLGGLVDVNRVRSQVHTLMAPVISMQGISMFLFRESMRAAKRGPFSSVVDASVLDYSWKPEIKEELQNNSTIIVRYETYLRNLQENFAKLNLVTSIRSSQELTTSVSSVLGQIESLLVRKTDDGSLPQQRVGILRSRKAILNSEKLVLEIQNRAVLSDQMEVSTKIKEIVNILGQLELMLFLYLSNIERSGIRMTLLESGLLRDYLLKNRVADEKFEMLPEKLEEIILTEIYAFEPEAAMQGIEIRVTSGILPPIKCCGYMITRMLGYLLDNAIKYSFEKPDAYLLVSYGKEGKHAQISIENYGTGMTKDELESKSLLEFGTRGTLAWDRNREGSGIGLSEVLRIVKMHNGELLIESKPPANIKQEDITKDTPHKNTVTVKLPF
jgi:signal transduction histidine kinase